MSRFSVGDIVILKSGGPLMTVDDARPDGIVEAVWFDDDDHICGHAFVASMLLTESEGLARMRDAADEFVRGLDVPDGYDA